MYICCIGVSELIQVTRDPHPEFMTEWTSYVEKYITQNINIVGDKITKETNGQLNLANHKCCLVAEAHGFSGDYVDDCDVCRQESMSNVFEMFSKCDIDKFYEWKDMMYDHMKEAHWTQQ